MEAYFNAFFDFSYDLLRLVFQDNVAYWIIILGAFYVFTVIYIRLGFVWIYVFLKGVRWSYGKFGWNWKYEELDKELVGVVRFVRWMWAVEPTVGILGWVILAVIGLIGQWLWEGLIYLVL